MPLARAAEKHYLNLGGNITYQSRVTKILVENESAVGACKYEPELNPTYADMAEHYGGAVPG